MRFETERKRLVQSLIDRGYISKKEVIAAMGKVPRECFVPLEYQDAAYYDCPLEIGEGQTISAPHMVGIMVENLNLEKGHKVLEVGGGSGYHAAIVAEIVGDSGHVYSVERIESLAKKAEENLKKCSFSNRVTIIIGDGSKGLPEFAPYDRIFVSCAAPTIPKNLIAQLKDGGKLLIPVGNRFFQDLIGCWKKGDRLLKENHGGCVFVPLIGEHGFK